ncbi:leukemia-associated protein 7 [Pelodytes ibericus]
MPGPSVLGIAMEHQTTAFYTLRTLMQTRFLSSGEPHNGLKEEADHLLSAPHRDNEEGSSSSVICANTGRPRIIMGLEAMRGEPATSTREHFTSSPRLIYTANYRGVSSTTSSRKAPTLAHIASRNCLSRVLKCTAQLLLVEQDAVNHLPLNCPLNIQLKDNIEFSNICTHMTLQVEDRLFGLDLNAAQGCLKTIITDLILAFSAFSSEFFDAATDQLNQILHNLEI